MRARQASLPYFHPAEFRAGWCASTADKKFSLLGLIILALTAYWLLGFFGQSIVPGVQHTSSFIDFLCVVIVLLIIVKFLT